MQFNLPIVFDSDRFVAAQRMEVAREEFGRRVLQIEMNSIGEQPFRVRLAAESFGDARVGVMSFSPLCQSRGREYNASSDGAIGFAIPLRGRFRGGHCGNYFSLAAGQIMAFRTDKEGIVDCPTGGSILSIVTRQDQLLEVPNMKTLKFGECLHFGGEGLALLHAYLRFIGNHGMRATESGRALIGRHIVDLLALGLVTNAGTANKTDVGSLLTACYAAIQTEIDQHFREAWIGVEICASKLGLSVRSVQDICWRNGTSFVAEINRRRLAMARDMLKNPANLDMRIIDIALDCGFRDLSHFNRQFRAVFGGCPGEFRNLGAIE